MLITQKLFNDIEPGEVFRVVTTKYQTFHNSGKQELTFVCIKGYNNDWCIYAGLSTSPVPYIEKSGDKVTSPALIRSLVPCEDSVFKTYRY